jgi:hypothetical protein
MLLHVCLAVNFVLPAAAVEPSDDAVSVKWRKETAYVLTGEGVPFEIAGPTAVILDLRGDDGVKHGPVAIEILRDGSHLSKNEVTFRRGRGGPKGLRNAAKLAFQAPDGRHTYRLKTTSSKVAVKVTTQKRLPKRVAVAAAETDVAAATVSDEPPEAPAPPPEEPAETEVAAAPADPAAGDESSEIEDLEAATAEAAQTVAMLETPAAGHSTGLEAALRVAVYDFDLQDIDPKVGKVVSDSLVSEIRKLAGVSAIGMDEIRDMLSHEANKQLLGCESDESCLAEIAGALGVDNLVTGVLSKVGDGHVLVIRRIDQRRAQVAGAVNKRLKAGAGQEFLLAIGPAVEELFPDRQLREGAERGVPREVALRIDPPPLPKWSFYAVAGGAVGAAAVGGLFGFLARDKESQYQDKANDGLTSVIDGADLVPLGEAAQQRADIANYAFIGAGALAVSAGVMAFFTDWWGYGDEAE